jgi:HEPN domain-containing protein/predicted nucleotidyltransferase
MPEVDPADLCFQAQQAVEKALKAVLVSRGIIAPRTHDLNVLLRRLEALGVRTPAEVADAPALTFFAVEARYPGHARVGPEEYEGVLRRMDAALAWASDLIAGAGGVREMTHSRYGVSAEYVRDGRLDAELLQQIVARVVHACSPELVILFGSAARGEMHGDSDVDLLVVRAGDERPFRVAQAIYGELKGEVPVDVLVMTPEELERCGRTPGYVCYDALREGRVLYTRPAPAG